MLIDDLRAIQENHGYLPEDKLRELSTKRGCPLYEVQGVASFYPYFHLEPPPPVRVEVCTDLACHLSNASSLQDQIRHDIPPSDQDKVLVGAVSCLGRCDQPCAVSVNGHIHENVQGKEVITLIREVLEGKDPVGATPKVDPGPWELDPYEKNDEYQALRNLLANQAKGKLVPALENTMKKLEDAGLRGMGGAGFPTGLKWKIVREATGFPKYVICNADESEPGTFKDRVILESLPHLLVEGMIMAGLVIGSEKGIIYLRHEYDHVLETLERALDDVRREGLLGTNILGTGRSFDITTFISPGGYICGEETALLEALEGKRAEPRNKPPFPGNVGLWGKPTLINNVETFAHVPAIYLKGAEWFIEQGEGNAAGLKFFALSGDVNHPGVYEVPMGISARKLIEDYGGGVSGGRELMAIMPGGTSSGFLPATMADTALDFKPLEQAGSMLGSGAVVAIAEGRDMLDLAFNALRFFRNESCGKCVPCRMGTEKIVDILQGALAGRGQAEAKNLIEELSATMMETSICGLGQAAPNPILSVIRHFPEHVLERIGNKS